MTPVHVPLGCNDAHYGLVTQVGFHESGNDNLVAIQGAHDLQWHHYTQVRKG